MMDSTVEFEPSEYSAAKDSETAKQYQFYDIPLETVVAPVYVEYDVSEVAAAQTYLNAFLKQFREY